MCAEIVGGADELRERPIVYNGVCPVSPLKLPHEVTEVIIETARWGLPCNILSMAMAGGSSPVTLAGTMVTHNAEVLAGITLVAAHRAWHAGHLRQLDHGHGPQARRGERRLAGDRHDQRRRGPDGATVPDPELRGRVVGGLEAR